MPSYSASLKKLIIEQVLSQSKTLEQIQEEYKVSRTTIFRWLAQYRSKLNQVNDELNANALSDFAYENSDLLDHTQCCYGHSKVEHNHEIIKFYCQEEVYEHKLIYGNGQITKAVAKENTSPKTDNHKIDTSAKDTAELTQESSPKAQAKTGYFREFKLSELFQAAIKAQMSLWHGPKCEEISHYYGISMEQLREFYELVNQEGLVSGSLYSQLQHQIVSLQEQVQAYKHKVQALEAKEELYLFYLDAFKKQSAQLKLDFTSLNDHMKQDFLALIQKLRAQGMTTQEAADLIGINMRTYYRWLKQVPNQDSPIPASASTSTLGLGQGQSQSQGIGQGTSASTGSGSSAQDAKPSDHDHGNGLGNGQTLGQEAGSTKDHTQGYASTYEHDKNHEASNGEGLKDQAYGTKHSSSNIESYYEHAGQISNLESKDLSQDHNLSDALFTKSPSHDVAPSNPLKINGDRAEYKFISQDEIELIKEIVLLPEYQGLKVKDCYDKLKNEQLLTMSLSTFYRTINQDPALKAALKGKHQAPKPKS